MLRRRYRLSERSRLVASAQPPWLICEHPLQALPLNPAAATLLAALDGEAWLDELVAPVSPRWIDYLDGLAERGLLRAEYRVVTPADWPRVHIVIPVYRDAERLRRCLESLAALDYPAARRSVTVVDDRSPIPLPTDLGGLPPALRRVRLERNSGPASARNAGVASLGALPPAEWLAFIDSDCEAEPEWLSELVTAAEGEDYAAVGGAVLGLRADSLLARYEQACSSLSMGVRASRVAAKDAPVSYLPACNLLVRADAFRALGGFRAGWRTGEDVDFCWRLAESGRRLFYWPGGAGRGGKKTQRPQAATGTTSSDRPAAGATRGAAAPSAIPGGRAPRIADRRLQGSTRGKGDEPARANGPAPAPVAEARKRR